MIFHIFPMIYEQLEFLLVFFTSRNHESKYLEKKDEIGHSFAAELVQAQRTLALQRPFFWIQPLWVFFGTVCNC